MAISIGSVLLHHRHPREEEDKVEVEDTIVDNVEEDVEGTAESPRNTNACGSDRVGIRCTCP